MKHRILHCPRLPLVLIALASAMALSNQGVSANVKGDWVFTISPQGSAGLRTTLVLRKNGKGTGGTEISGGPLAYQETETELKISWEFEGPVFPAQFVEGPATIIMRGTKVGENSVIGAIIIITDHPDPDSPTGYVTKTGEFVAVKQ